MYIGIAGKAMASNTALAWLGNAWGCSSTDYLLHAQRSWCEVCDR